MYITNTYTIFSEHYAALNVPVVDAKLQSRVLVSLKASLELITAFATQLSTLHSYLQQVLTTWYMYIVYTLIYMYVQVHYIYCMYLCMLLSPCSSNNSINIMVFVSIGGLRNYPSLHLYVHVYTCILSTKFLYIRRIIETSCLALVLCYNLMLEIQTLPSELPQ